MCLRQTKNAGFLIQNKTLQFNKPAACSGHWNSPSAGWLREYKKKEITQLQCLNTATMFFRDLGPHNVLYTVYEELNYGVSNE